MGFNDDIQQASVLDEGGSPCGCRNSNSVMLGPVNRFVMKYRANFGNLKTCKRDEDGQGEVDEDRGFGQTLFKTVCITKPRH